MRNIKLTLLFKEDASLRIAGAIAKLSAKDYDVEIDFIGEFDETIYSAPYLEHGSNIMSGEEACIDYML